MTRRSKIELRNKSWDVYPVLQKNGVHISITTDHPYIPIQYLNIAASIAVREGLDEESALKGITIHPAENLGIEDRVGSIDIGKDADLVLWDHHLFDYRAKPIMTMINGEIVYKQ
jgi:imidazolonepropionase-like amidohydrolase